MDPNPLPQQSRNPRTLSRRELAQAALASAIVATIGAPSSAIAQGCTSVPATLRQAMKRLERAYPDFIASADERNLLWKDGTSMSTILFPPGRSTTDTIRNPDLAAQVSQIYPRGNCSIPADPLADPGRTRYAPFFDKIYGANRAEVSRNLVQVAWPSRHAGATIEFTRVNGAADHLHKVASELSSLPPEFHRFFDSPSGGFYWRNIAGTNRRSGHAFGIAIDVNVSQSDYWRNELHGAPDEPINWRSRHPRNRIPHEVVKIFERHGFIWGGKWFHYDTMHFEFRPEMLLP